MARSVGKRIKEHAKGKSLESHEHLQTKYEGQFQEIQVKTLNRCRGDAMLRQNGLGAPI